jgi:hypothetical protein
VAIVAADHRDHYAVPVQYDGNTERPSRQRYSELSRACELAATEVECGASVAVAQLLAIGDG